MINTSPVLSRNRRWRGRGLLFEAVAALLVPAQVLLAVPPSEGPPPGGTPIETSAATAPLSPEELPALLAALAKETTPPPPPPKVKVNRTVPRVDQIPAYPIFSERPTEQEIFRARVFGEPLVPVGGSPSEEENRTLAEAITVSLHQKDNDRFERLEAFLKDQPSSPWRASLLMNLGILYRQKAYYTRADRALREAWDLAKGADQRNERAVADRSLGELLDLHMSFGHVAVLEDLLAQAKDRDVLGGAAERVRQADAAVWGLTNKHEDAIPSGPVGLARIREHLSPGIEADPVISAFHATPDGASLVQIWDLAQKAGMKVRLALREPGAKIPVPSLMHLKAQHFSAVVKQEGDRYLLDDPLLGGDVWMSKAALEEETSGYFLIREGALPTGWSAAEDAVAATLRGKCVWPTGDAGATGRCNGTTPNGCGRKPMATYSFHTLMASLSITDTPVGYTPPRGPAPYFQVTYNQREAFQPGTFYFSNLGNRWNSDWISYLEDDPGNLSADVKVFPRGGGRKIATGFGGQSYQPDRDNQAVLTRISPSPIKYERLLRDGSKEVFAQADGAMVSPRRVFMTEVIDPQGNKLTFGYDSQLRLVSVTDAIGQVTTLSYDLTTDPLKITKVTDPFGRFATFEYNADGSLVRITDIVGIQSEFIYGSSDFVSSLTTPYGTTTFANGRGYNYKTDFWVEATDPLGAKERVEYVYGTAAIPATDPVVPPGFASENTALSSFSSYYFDKRAMALYPGDYSKASIIRWNNASTFAIVDSPGSVKRPLENRVWYKYASAPFAHGVGPMNRPTQLARVLDDGTSQIVRFEYDPKAYVTRFTDPLGRETVFEYDPANDIDLLRVKQKNASTYELVQSFTYNTQHLPLTSTDTAGQTTTFTYNPQGQPLTVTTPPRAGITETRVTTFSYDSNGYLQTLTGPATGATVSFGYDGYGRVRTVTDSEGYAITVDYDAMDRPTRVTYPDGTYEQAVYDRLDPEQLRDRLGRWTHLFHDALGRVASVRDGLGRTTTLAWCNCGSMDKLIDPNGNVTSWERDLEERVTKELRADGTATEVTYESASSRVKQVKDPKGQLSKYEYFLDDSPKRVRSTNAADVDLVPSVSFTYDASYPRPLTKLDGAGTTTYAYNPIPASPALGAGELASIDGPLANDTILYSYDELGRVKGETVGGVSSSLGFDALGRVTSQTNALGTFGYGYVGATERPSTITYPSGQSTAFSYFPHSGDDRLQQILHSKPGGALLSKHAYTYDGNGNLKTWLQQTDTSAAKQYEFGYDGADQLTSAALKTTDPTPVVLKRYAYAYDSAGNRTSEQVDDVATQALANNLNQLTTLQPGGALKFAGSVNEPATVTVQGQPATVNPNNTFEGRTQVGAGTNTVAVQATDPSGNVRTNNYQVSAAGSTKTLIYDLNGNLLSDGTRTYEWDALDQLTAVNQGTNRSEFTYDGEGHRVRIVEKVSGSVTADRRFLWCGDEICEERDATGGTTVKRFFEGGVQQSGVTYFATGDHLGSGRELTDGTGAIRARYEYDPYGRRTKTSGDLDADYGFAGMLAHGPTGLGLATYRGYDPGPARWLNQDPMGLDGGINLYAYVEGNPILLVDPLGLSPWQNLLNSWWMGWVNPGSANFAAGFGHNFTFGITTWTNNFMGNSVNQCSTAFKAGVWSSVALSLVTSGGSALLKGLAKNASRTAVRNAAKPFIRNFPGTGGIVHHVNPLFGNSGAWSKIPIPFPTGGLPPWMHSGWWNLTRLPNLAAHMAAHARLVRNTRVFGALFNTPFTAGRSAFAAAGSCP